MGSTIRRFADSQGTRWSVRAEWRPDVVLALGPGGRASRHDRQWLYFRSQLGTRRVDAFPGEWYELDAAGLEQLLARAKKAPG